MEEERDKEFIEALEKYGWNFEVVADRLDCDAEELRAKYSHLMRNVANPSESEGPFNAIQIGKDNIRRIRELTKDLFIDSMPLLFQKSLPKERVEEITNSVLIENGLPWVFTNSSNFPDAYQQLKEEALTLEKWREQIAYLDVIEEALFKMAKDPRIRGTKGDGELPEE